MSTYSIIHISSGEEVLGSFRSEQLAYETLQLACKAKTLDPADINEYAVEENEMKHDYHDDDDYLIDGVGFADPGGNSALRRSTPTNPRNLPCPTCGTENVLTPLDRAAGYQCDRCADRDERGGY